MSLNKHSEFQGEFMSMLILDRDVQEEIQKPRELDGLAKYDEVWEGVTIVMSLPDIVHQRLVQGFSFSLQSLYGWPSPHEVFPGTNVSDRITDWKQNYREPDVLVYLQGNPAVFCGTHWCGGPDFLIEIMSPSGESRDKLPFYASVNTREVLVIDRDPWQLELYQLHNGAMVLSGQSDISNGVVLTSSVMPVSFQLISGQPRPHIQVRQTVTGQSWTI